MCVCVNVVVLVTEKRSSRREVRLPIEIRDNLECKNCVRKICRHRPHEGRQILLTTLVHLLLHILGGKSLKSFLGIEN